MSKFYGPIGFANTVKTAPGVVSRQDIEKYYAGEIFELSKQYQNGDKVNDDISLNMSLSIIADPFAANNIGMVRYITYLGNKWKVTSIKIAYPRIQLTIGGLYNG